MMLTSSSSSSSFLLVLNYESDGAGEINPPEEESLWFCPLFLCSNCKIQFAKVNSGIQEKTL